MKNTKGLQIGNFVYYQGTEDICKVNLIHGENHYDSYDKFGNFIPNGKYEFISLTNDWLLKLGYSVHPWGWVKENMPLISFSKSKYWVNFGNGFRIDLPYVHTLQNLEQLTIK